MTTIRTTARLTLAVLTVGLGAAFAPAADHKPIKSASRPVVNQPYGFSWGMSYPNGWSLGASNPTGKFARDLDGQSAGTERTKKPEQPHAKAPYLGDTGTHEVGHVKGMKRR